MPAISRLLATFADSASSSKRITPPVFHLASLMNKIGARNRVQIAIWAYETRRVRP